MLDNVTVIIRNVGERTLDSCHKIISNQINTDNIFVINEVPFSKAVLKTFQIGIERKKEWTLVIDADLLLKDNAIKEMITKAKTKSEKLYVYQGMILDYLFGTYRFGGPHLYKTSVLPKALKIVENNLLEIRPESFTYKELAKKDYITYCDNVCYAIHDFEQDYKDYYRKGFFHGKKALDDQLLSLIKQCKENISKDSNYEFAMHGLFDGLVFEEEIEVDINFFNNMQKKNKSVSDIINKSKGTLNLEPNYVASIIDKHKKNLPKNQPNSYKAYYLNNKGKHIVFSYKNPIYTFITKLFIFTGNLLLKKGLKMRES